MVKSASTPVRAANAFAFENSVSPLGANSREAWAKLPNGAFFLPKIATRNLITTCRRQKHLALVEFGAKMLRDMKRAKIKTAVPLSAGERYVEFTDSSKQLGRARKALGLKANEALLVFTDGEREFAVATDVH
jgi:hypothetical protein